VKPAAGDATATGACAQCGAPFRCGMEAGDAECWCASLPPLLSLPAVPDPAAAANCLCPACLKARLALAPA
jgi:hypothetical protein